MNKTQAIKELKDLINLNYSHAVLLKDSDGYRVELHGGHAGNCCCCAHEDFVWREKLPWTDPEELNEI